MRCLAFIKFIILIYNFCNPAQPLLYPIPLLSSLQCLPYDSF